jgi:pimeloyl-ACP methyl ester carboxylesterase
MDLLFVPRVSVNGFKLHYEIEGEGEPLVLIPGFASGRSIWSRQTPALSQNFRVITFDPRGVDASDKSDGPQSIGLLADDLAHLLLALHMHRAHVVGVSFGGFVAQEFALKYPAMTRKLVLCCTSFGGPNHVKSEREMELASIRELNLSQFEAAVSFDAESRVVGIRRPTLVWSGDADAIVPVQNSRNLAAKIPGAQLRIIEDGSHTFFMERAEEFNQLVTDFLLSQQLN